MKFSWKKAFIWSMNKECQIKANIHQKQRCRRVLKKSCSENMQQIYRRTPCRSVISTTLQSNFIEIALWYGCSPVNLLHIFRTCFPWNTSGWLLLIQVCFLRHVTRRRGEIHPGVNFFWDTSTFHLGLKTEKFHPGVKWIFWSFCMIFYVFSFYENTDILISFNWQKISDKEYY